MFSYIKILDICEENITITINTKKPETTNKIKKLAVKNFIDKATIIYKEDGSEDYFIICKKYKNVTFFRSLAFKLTVQNKKRLLIHGKFQKSVKKVWISMKVIRIYI